MMTNSTKKLSVSACAAIAFAAMLIAAATMLAGLTIGAGTAWAGGGSAIGYLENNKAVTVTYLTSGQDEKIRVFGDYTNFKKISNAKSSKTSVAKVKVLKGKQSIYDPATQSTTEKTAYSIQVTMKKPGTTKITFKHNGKKHAVKYTVKKYANPFASFKVGGVQYSSAFKQGNLASGIQARYHTNVETDSGQFSGKLVYKLAKGWKMDSLMTSAQGGFVNVKNKTKLNKCGTLWITVKNAKTGASESFVVAPEAKSTETLTASEASL